MEIIAKADADAPVNIHNQTMKWRTVAFGGNRPCNIGPGDKIWVQLWSYEQEFNKMQDSRFHSIQELWMMYIWQGNKQMNEQNTAHLCHALHADIKTCLNQTAALKFILLTILQTNFGNTAVLVCLSLVVKIHTISLYSGERLCSWKDITKFLYSLTSLFLVELPLVLFLSQHLLEHLQISSKPDINYLFM